MSRCGVILIVVLCRSSNLGAPSYLSDYELPAAAQTTCFQFDKTSNPSLDVLDLLPPPSKLSLILSLLAESVGTNGP